MEDRGGKWKKEKGREVEGGKVTHQMSPVYPLSRGPRNRPFPHLCCSLWPQPLLPFEWVLKSDARVRNYAHTETDIHTATDSHTHTVTHTTKQNDKLPSNLLLTSSNSGLSQLYRISSLLLLLLGVSFLSFRGPLVGTLSSSLLLLNVVVLEAEKEKQR